MLLIEKNLLGGGAGVSIFESVSALLPGQLANPASAFFIKRAAARPTVAWKNSSCCSHRTFRVSLKSSQNDLLVIERAPRDLTLELPIELNLTSVHLNWDEESKNMSIEFFEIQNDETQFALLKVSIDLGMCVLLCDVPKHYCAGRLPCPLCGISIDPQGHLCPRANGYRR